MRKYWKLTTITICIVLSLGTFYVNSARSAEHHPEFVIQTLSGDTQEVKSLVLEGSYMNSSPMNYISADLKITAQDSTYNNRSFLDQIIGHYPTVIKELQEEYRTFMRGKDPLVNLYFEDNEFLAYADADYSVGSMGPKDFNFEIAVLNKGDGEINSFTLEVPDGGELQHVFVEDVQVIENKLYLITQHTVSKNEDYNEEMYIYEIDLVNQRITSHEAVLNFTQWEGNSYTNIHLVNSSPTAATEHIIMLKTEEKMMNETESTRVTDRKQEIISIDLATKENETLDIPGLSLEENQLSFVEGSTLYFTRVEEQELVVTPYRLGENQVDQDFRIQLQTTTEKEDAPFPLISVKEGKLYVASQQMNSKSKGDVAVVDVQTGETLFKGQIALKNSSEEKTDYELYMHEIYVK